MDYECTHLITPGIESHEVIHVCKLNIHFGPRVFILVVIRINDARGHQLVFPEACIVACNVGSQHVC